MTFVFRKLLLPILPLLLSPPGIASLQRLYLFSFILLSPNVTLDN